MNINKTITSKLFSMQDLEYRDFHSKLMPNISKDRIIGVRVPELRKLVKDFAQDSDIDNFLSDLPHYYYEENNIHAFIISKIKDYDKCIEMLNKFLPYVDNWATCDTMRPVVFKKNTDKLISEIKKWIFSDKPYIKRFGIEMLMTYYLDNEFKEKYLDTVSSVKSDEYYVNMMIAWYFATALAKQYDFAVKYLENKRLPDWVHNKTIQKAIESFRVTDEHKKYLRSLKI